MPVTDLFLLLLLAAIWGASYLFIKVAVLELSPLTLAAARLALGSAGLLAILLLSGQARRSSPPSTGYRQQQPLWLRSLVLGLLGAVIPYLLIAWGEVYATSGAAAVLNATSPLFSTLFGHIIGLWGREERLTWTRAAGLLFGLTGVSVLTLGSGPAPGAQPGGFVPVLAHLAVVLASASYGAGALYARLAFAGAPALLPATAQTVAGAAMTVPLALLFSLPASLPSRETAASVLVLGLLGTVLAYLIYYRVLARLGATGVLSVTYLLPAFALAYGAVLLDEPLGVASLVALALILLGVALTTGMIRRPK